MTLLLVIDHYFQIFASPAVNFLLYTPISPIPVQFSSSFPSIFHMFLH